MRPARRPTLALLATLSAALLVAAPSALGARPLARGVVVIETNLDYQGASAAGTGVVIRSGGEVLTNNHVIRGATTIRVIVPGGRSYSASVVGYDIGDDIAVLKLDGASGLATVSLGSSSKLRRGQAVTAVGNAGGTGTLVTAPGTITGLARSITVQDDEGNSARLSGLIQTNADLRPGDSGGPLLDRSGRVVGIDAAASVGFAFRSSTSSQGYAIPINHALSLVKQMEAGRASQIVHIGPTAFLGISVRSGSFGIEDTPGALVADVVPSGPAAQAGLAAGDVITSIDGTSVSSPADVVPLLQRAKPGDTVSVVYSDQLGNQTTASVQLASGPPQ
jgi:S1-C subfamily serine protease